MQNHTHNLTQPVRLLYHTYRKCSRYSPPEQQLVFDHADSLASAPTAHIFLDHILKQGQ